MQELATHRDNTFARTLRYAHPRRCIKPVQKQTSAGQRTRFKAYVAVGDSNGHVGLGQKCAKEVANAIRAAITVAKLNVGFYLLLLLLSLIFHH